MPRRVLSRCLLSLLMLWQLSASVSAHSIVSPQAMTEASAAEPCHEHMTGPDAGAATDMSHAGHAAQDENAAATHMDGCKAACKCPCAGTPALSFALPAGVILAPDAARPPLFTGGFASPSLADPLRPPI